MSEQESAISVDNNNVSISPVSGDTPHVISPGSPESASAPESAASSGGQVKQSGVPVFKPSGIKPPSKIGRPCAGTTKPALPIPPATPKSQTGDYSIDLRRDDYRRQKLTDVDEGDENEGDNYDRTNDTLYQQRKTRQYSVSSNVSMDTLWDLHPRRLSEAGLRRHSDASVVLTEDTDSFIIGMRVWVGGTKPGQIAYLGETQFAPGEWAGIVLDEPIGKNDGSVSGTRYFQCEPKRGVFSRLTRLTLSPLVDAVDTASVRSIPTNGTRKSSVSSLADSIRGTQRTPLPGMNVSVSSLSSSHHQELKIGERVIVQSSQGSKPGTLRYIGTTEFANGEWCGVELDDPLGKNDGSVDGKRYFECQPKFGLFAPVAKVSKSPSNRKPGQCVVHKSGTSLRRANSKESMTSMTSNASSVRRVRLGVTSLTPNKRTPNAASTPISKNTLQDVLREKEHHIEQLIKERELERAEFSRISNNHAQQTEGKIKLLKEEYEQYRAECEEKFHEHLSLLAQMKNERDSLSNKLDDEKKRLEDATFRFEEELISRGDLEVTNKSQLEKILELEKLLEFERHKNEKLEKDFDIFKVKNLDREKRSTDKESEINELRAKLKKVTYELDQKANIEKALEEKDAIIQRLRNDLNTANELLKQNKIDNEVQVIKDLRKAEIELSSKTHDVEENEDKIKSLESDVTSLKKQLDEANEIVKSNCKVDTSAKEAELEKETNELKQTIKTIKEEMFKSRRESASIIAEKDMQLREYDVKLKYEQEEADRLKAELNQTVGELSAHHESRQQRHKRQIEQREMQIAEIASSFESKSEELITCQILTTQLETEICNKNDIIEKLKMEYSTFSRSFAEQKMMISKLMADLQAAELKTAEWQNKFNFAQKTIVDLQNIKQQLELQIQNILHNSQNSGAQLNSLSEELRKLQTAMENMRIEMTHKLEAAAQIEQELRLRLQQQQDQFGFEKSNLEQQLKVAVEAEAVARASCEKSIEEASQMQKSLQMQIIELQKTIETNKLEFTKEIEAANEKIHEFMMIIEKVRNEKVHIQQELSFKIEQMTSELIQLKQIIKEKEQLIIQAEEKLNQHLLESANLSQQDKMTFEQEINRLQIEINKYKQEIQEKTIMLDRVTIEINELKTSKFQIEQMVNEQQIRFNELKNTHAKCESQYSEIKNQLVQTEMKLQEMNVQISTITNEKVKLEKTIVESNVQIQQLTSQINQLNVQQVNINNIIQEKENKIIMMTNELHQVIQQKESMNAVLAERENKIVVLMNQLEVVQKEKGTNTELFQKQEKQMIELKMELQRVMQEKTEINNYIVQKDQHIAELTQKLEENTRHIQVILQEKEKEISITKEQLHVIEEQKTAIQQAMHEKEQHLIVLNNNIQALHTEKMILENSVKEHQQNFISVKEELRKTGDCQTATKAVVQEMEDKIQEKEATIQLLQNDVTKLRQEWSQPTNNPIVFQIMSQLEEKEKEIQQKEQQIIVLNNEVKQAVQQTEEVQQSWQASVEQWKEKVVQLESVKENAAHRCENLQQQVFVLQQQQQEQVKVREELHEERQKYAEIYAQLTASEQQKTELIQKLEVVAEQKQTREECKPVVQIIKEIQRMPAIEMHHFQQQVEENKIEVHRELEETRMQLVEKEKELTIQKQECANLQQQLLKVETRVVEVPVPVPGPVQIVEKCTAAAAAEVQAEAQVNNKVVMHEKPQVTWYQPTQTVHYSEAPIPVTQKPIQQVVYQSAQTAAETNSQVNVVPEYTSTVQQPQYVVQQTKPVVQIPSYKPIYQQVQQVPQSTMTPLHVETFAETSSTTTAPVIQYTQPKPIVYYVNKPEMHAPVRQEASTNAVVQPQVIHHTVQKPVYITQPIYVQAPAQAQVQAQVQAQTLLQAQALAQANTQAQAQTQSNVHAQYNPYVPYVKPFVQSQSQAAVGVAACQTNMQELAYQHSLAVGQVEFLNSIIVDMQRKNEELRNKIQILESGCLANSAAAAAAEATVGIRKVMPPRQYCDICEIFDAHETEDCPVQVTDADVNNVIRTLQPGARPYCDICEAFGHDTAQCNVAEEY